MQQILNSSVLTICLCLALSSPSLVMAQNSVDCGARCLMVGLSAFEFDVKYATLLKKLGNPTSDGYSLADLADQAAANGAKTALVKTSPKNLLKRHRSERFACICWLKNKHFVICSDIDGNAATIVDPPERRRVELAAFQSQWDGEALLISSEPLMDEGSLERSSWIPYIVGICAVAVVFGTPLIYRFFLKHIAVLLVLAFPLSLNAQGPGQLKEKADAVKPRSVITVTVGKTNRRINLGSLELSEESLFKCPLLNDSRGAIEIADLSVSCPCIAVKLEKGTLQPGESAVLWLNPQTSRGGPQRSVLSVFTSPGHVGFQILVEWQVDQPLRTDPEILDFGEVDNTKEFHIKFRLQRRNSEGDYVPTTAVHASTSGIHTVADVKGSEIEVTLKNAPPDHTTERIYVADRELPKGTFATFDVHWRVKSHPVLHNPKDLYLLTGKKGAEASILLVSTKESLPDVASITSSHSVDSWSFNRVDRKRGRVYVRLSSKAGSDDKLSLTVNFTQDMPPLIINGRITRAVNGVENE